ncbi:kinase, partial [Alistipes putredinis]
MEYFGNIIAVTMHELTRSDDGEAVMSRSAYDHLVTRGRVNVLRPGKGLGSYALIEYHSLPERFRLRFEAKYGNPEKIMKQEDMPLAVDSEAQKYYHEYL